MVMKMPGFFEIEFSLLHLLTASMLKSISGEDRGWIGLKGQLQVKA